MLDLRALHLYLGKYHTEPCKPEISFHKLERLTLGKIHVSNWPQTNIPQHVFSPTCMPKLRHLALHHVDYFELVSAVLPQITTLAIFDSHSTRNLTFLSLSDALPLLVKLKHLSLAGYNEAIPQLFGSAQGNQLESLHLGICTLEHHLEVATVLVGIVEQQRKDNKKGRIVIYGWNRVSLRSFDRLRSLVCSNGGRKKIRLPLNTLTGIRDALPLSFLFVPMVESAFSLCL